jgi:hypothetical protein
MRILGPKHTAESVARELADGLERGTIDLGRPDAPDPNDPWDALAVRVGREVATRLRDEPSRRSDLGDAGAVRRQDLIAVARAAAAKAMEELLEAEDRHAPGPP